MKKRTPGPAELFRRLDAHQAKLETWLHDRRIELAVLVHFFDALANLAFGKFAHAVAKHLLVFRQRSQRTRERFFDCSLGWSHIRLTAEQWMTTFESTS